jgi:hypothetical protein
MKKIAYFAFIIVLCTTIAAAQSEAAGNARFPGLSAQHLKILNAAKKVTAIPLPTWLPAGFKAESVIAKLGARVPLEDKRLAIIYSRALASGKMQRFSLEAGLDGIGGLPYDVTMVIPTAVGEVDLMYEPNDPDDDKKKITRFSMTEWFKVGRTDFHFDGMYGIYENDKGLTMISLADTEKILRSLRRF